MKALTLTAPYGTLIALAAQHPDLGKHIETRSWATSYRGPLAIHQAVSLKPVGGTTGLIDLLERDRFWLALHQIAPGVFRTPGFVKYLPRGKIVAVAQLLDCLPTAGAPSENGGGPKYADWVHELSDQERVFGNYTPGRYGWLLSDIRALMEPIPARGMLGLWQPDAVTQAAIERQLAPEEVINPSCG